MPRTLDQYPELLTVDEAAEYLRISRALGYQLARQYRITDGAAGLPVVQLGRCLRVPRRALARFVSGHRVDGTTERPTATYRSA